MRVVLIALILTIGVAGFSADARTFDVRHCATMSSIQSVNSTGQVECAYQAETTNESQYDDSKHGCLNCSHCCAFHAAMVSPGSYDLQDIVRDNPIIASDEVHYGFASKLKRPPRFLV